MNVNKKLIERFQTHTKEVYLIKDVNEDFKLKFFDFCISENYSQNTIARALKFIKTICYHAESNNIEVSKKLSGLQINTVKVEKTEEEFYDDLDPFGDKAEEKPRLKFGAK